MTRTRCGFADDSEREPVERVMKSEAKVSSATSKLGIDQNVLSLWFDPVQAGGVVEEVFMARSVRSTNFSCTTPVVTHADAR